LVLCDFGSAKKLIPGENNLSYICSRCYRAPELIFGSTGYTTQIDMWSVACVIIEMLHGLPLFIGDNSLDHLLEVIKVVGTPSKEEVLQMNPNYDISEYDLPVIKRKIFSRILPKADPKLIDLVNKLMVYNPHERFSAIEALAHNYFDELRQ
jgi:serine/threonine protein kinase